MRDFEDFQIGDVHELGSRRLTEAEIRGFARVYDPQPRHTGEAGSTPIASGWQVAVTFMRMYVSSVLRDAAAEVSPGIEGLQWLRPVRPGDLLVGRMTVLGTAPSMTRPDCGIVRQRGEMLDESGSVVMQLVFHGLMRRRTVSLNATAMPGGGRGWTVPDHVP